MLYNQDVSGWKLKIVAHWLFNDLWKERDKIINRAIEMLNATIKDENVVDYTDEVKKLNKKRKKYEEKNFPILLNFVLKEIFQKKFMRKRKEPSKSRLGTLIQSY